MTASDGAAHEIVVSAENNDYMAWQCLLFHWSCVHHQGVTPLVVVHGDEPALVEGFEILAANGGRIQREANHRHAGTMYAPRNQMRTLAVADTNAAALVLVDADVVFRSQVDLDAVAAAAGGRGVSLDRAPFLVVRDSNRAILTDVCVRADLDLDDLVGSPMTGATPHLVPAGTRDELCEHWAELLEIYLETALAHIPEGGPDVWIASMWGLVLAMRRLGLAPIATDLTEHTEDNPTLLAPDRRPLVHYSYPHESFNKRLYGRPDTWRAVWSAKAPPGTATGEVCRQLAEAGVFYGFTAST